MGGDHFNDANLSSDVNHSRNTFGEKRKKKKEKKNPSVDQNKKIPQSVIHDR